MSDLQPRKRLYLYSRRDARFDDHDEDPGASLVNLADVMLVFACGLLAALAAGTRKPDAHLRRSKVKRCAYKICVRIYCLSCYIALMLVYSIAYISLTAT